MKTKYWRVLCVSPASETRGLYQRNTWLGITAPTVKEAMAKVELECPNDVIHSINCGGTVDIQ